MQAFAHGVVFLVNTPPQLLQSFDLGFAELPPVGRVDNPFLRRASRSQRHIQVGAQLIRKISPDDEIREKRQKTRADGKTAGGAGVLLAEVNGAAQADPIDDGVVIPERLIRRRVMNDWAR